MWIAIVFILSSLVAGTLITLSVVAGFSLLTVPIVIAELLLLGAAYLIRWALQEEESSREEWLRERMGVWSSPQDSWRPQRDGWSPQRDGTPQRDGRTPQRDWTPQRYGPTPQRDGWTPRRDDWTPQRDDWTPQRNGPIAEPGSWKPPPGSPPPTARLGPRTPPRAGTR